MNIDYQIPTNCICQLTVKAYDRYITESYKPLLFVNFVDTLKQEATVRYPNGDRRTVDCADVLQSSIIRFGSPKYLSTLYDMPVFPRLILNEKFKARLLEQYPDLTFPDVTSPVTQQQTELELLASIDKKLTQLLNALGIKEAACTRQ